LKQKKLKKKKFLLVQSLVFLVREMTSCKIKDEKWVDGEYYAKLVCGKEE
jgi:hypothetical protein